MLLTNKFQSKLLELSGSWFDPSNPVLKRKDKPRSDIYERAESIGNKTDLVLVLGSSLTSSSGTRTMPRLPPSTPATFEETLDYNSQSV